MSRRRAAAAALAGLLLQAAPADPGTSTRRPAGLPRSWRAVPLGRVRVTQYTHVETRTRLTSSGYLLKDEDEGLVCAVSRDWWRRRVRPGDLLWVERFAQPCVALDTMARRNRRGLRQTRWVDIYVTDRRRGLEFGIRHSSAFLIHPRGYWKRERNPEAARRLRESLSPN